MKQGKRREYDERFPELGQFLGGYFYQGWYDEYNWKGQEPSFEPVVDFYKVKNPSTMVARATAQLEKFLGLQLDDEKLDDIVTSEFGVNYNLKPRGLSKRQWLEEVLKLLKQPTPAKTVVLEMR